MILRSTRMFDEISIRIWNFTDFSVLRLIDILKKNRADIRKISFTYTVIDEGLLIKLLNFLPKLEEIALDVSLSGSAKDVQKRLNCLTRVRIVTCRVESAKIIFELSDNILSSLSFNSLLHDSSPSKELLDEIIQRQSEIKDLNFDPSNVDLASLQALKLKKLRLVSGKQAWKIFQQQREVQALNFLSTSTSKDLIEICQLKLLQSLVVDVRGIDSSIVENLNDLKKLQELSIKFDSNQESLISKFSFPKLLKLDLIYSSKHDLEFEESSLFGSSNLKSLKLAQSNFNLFWKILNYKKLESLIIGTLTNSFDETLKHCESFRNNLKVLQIENAYGISHENFLTIVEALPEIQTISIGNGVKDFESLKSILMNCKRLAQVIISNSRFNLDLELIKLIKNYGKNLNYFEIGIIKVEENEGIKIYKKHFESQFEFYNLEDYKMILKNCNRK